MPALSPINILGHMVFIGKQHKMPTKADYVKPPDSWQYLVDSGLKFQMKIGQNKIGAKPSFFQPLPWFMPYQDPSANQHYFDSCDETGKNWHDFHEKMIDAVKFSHNMWKLQAKIKDLKVNAVTALGTPGCLDGPELESNIKNAPMVASWSGNAAKLRDAVAAGVSKCFKNWQGQVTVPGFPWYPAFAAFPAPQAPPMPNIPMPLIACVSSKMSEIVTPDTMKKEMINALSKSIKDKDGDKHHESAFEAIATSLALGFLTWLAAQQVMLVMGKGPIPTFAPPYVPVGPVVMGDNIAAPGHLMA